MAATGGIVGVAGGTQCEYSCRPLFSSSPASLALPAPLHLPSSASNSVCPFITGFYVNAGNVSVDHDYFDAGDLITLRGTGDVAMDADRSTFGHERVTGLPFEYRVPETGIVKWALYTRGAAGRLHFSCVPARLLTLGASLIVTATAVSGILLLVILLGGSRLIVGAIIVGVLTASLLASLQPLPVLDTGVAILDNQYVTIVGLGAAGGLAVCIPALLLVSVRSRFELFNWRHWAEIARRRLMPSSWPIAAGSAPSARDVVRRWFVAISASTGGMVASLGGLSEFYHALLGAFQPGKIVFTLLGATAAVVLFGPLHDYVLERGAGHEGAAAARGNPVGDLLETITPRRIVRFSFAVVIAFLVVICGECITEAARTSTMDAVILVTTAGLMPGAVSHFWSAALQYDAPSVARQTTTPTVVVGMIFSLPAGLSLSTSLVVLLQLSMGSQNVVAYVVGIPLLTLVIMAILGFVNYGVFALVGGFVLDRGTRISSLLFFVLAAAMVPLIMLVWTLMQILAALIVGESLLDYVDSDGLLQQGLIGVGWTAGLWLSGFPRLVQNRGAPASPAIAAN